jgi:hypothetical protein
VEEWVEQGVEEWVEEWVEQGVEEWVEEWVEVDMFPGVLKEVVKTQLFLNHLHLYLLIN